MLQERWVKTFDHKVTVQRDSYAILLRQGFALSSTITGVHSILLLSLAT